MKGKRHTVAAATYNNLLDPEPEKYTCILVWIVKCLLATRRRCRDLPVAGGRLTMP